MAEQKVKGKKSKYAQKRKSGNMMYGPCPTPRPNAKCMCDHPQHNMLHNECKRRHARTMAQRERKDAIMGYHAQFGG